MASLVFGLAALKSVRDGIVDNRKVLASDSGLMVAFSPTNHRLKKLPEKRKFPTS